MNTNFLNIIKRIVTEQGENILADPQRLKGFVKNYAANVPKEERTAFGRCIEAGCYRELKKAATPEARRRFKTALVRQLQKITGLSGALCSGAVDVLDAVVPVAQPAARRQKKAPASVSTLPPFPAVPAVSPMARLWSTLTQKKTMPKILLAALCVLALGLGVFFAAARRPLKSTEAEKSIQLDGNGNIIFTQKKNYDALIDSDLALTLNDVIIVQKYITEHFPDFDFDEKGYETDDYRNELLVKDFNENQRVMSIYLNGVKEMAGFSSTYAHLRIDANELTHYFLSIDQEFSDTSGFEYYNGRYGVTTKIDDKISAISVYKYLYIDTDEPYWIIRWDDDISPQARFTLLKDFLNELSYTKVYQNLGRDFFSNIHTGIEQHQTIKDIKNAKPPVVRPAVAKKPNPVPSVEERIKQTLIQTQKQVRDVNGDGNVNCIDYTVTFYRIYGTEAKMMRIYNNEMNHLFIRVGNRDIEPQRLDGSMENAWGSKYKPNESWDETYEWRQYAY
ncbi:MAG: hypothetical protein Ta2A_14190 [Treponemataceae bacterium]|nr:MAG: hypothetical protein Ta2A_14190 [Treponemataceae bacterium]